MKRLIMVAAGTALALLLGGCATTIRSDVTTFHQWPAQIQDKSYVFEVPSPQDDTLEWRSYQELVRAQLARQGFRDAEGATPALTVAMRFTTTDLPVRVLEPIMTPYFYPSARFGYGYGYRSFNRRYWGGWYSPFYDPFWGPYPAYQTSVEHHYRRELQVSIKAASDGKRLFDVTVHNTSRNMSTPEIMPALAHSAFEGFPGPSGVARRVEVKQEPKG
ncbi:DUF4136 domain-containing protein [Massilia arenae]|uniref:DUF4136 domain-containing protein n=1 Tax=Massilia arenae TaxID=2603288 RepID=A0A5C7FTL8_9BURK|nr:DUF4136 domain-containing protein [Massilia arenae]TXF97959.1 DUF4136 domain-containing protein [Massilia arenae]